jgi:hypothetical protein
MSGHAPNFFDLSGRLIKPARKQTTENRDHPIDGDPGACFVPPAGSGRSSARWAGEGALTNVQAIQHGRSFLPIDASLCGCSAAGRVSVQGVAARRYVATNRDVRIAAF